MISYDVMCTSRHRTEVRLASMFDDNPPCPTCGGATSRVPAAARLGNRADAGSSREEMPNTWHGIGRGDKDTIRHWHQRMTARERLEEKYPELAGDRRPVLAHEGVFHDRPLRAGDDLAPAVAAATFERTPTTTKEKTC
ncbi:zinc ribbon domain-containing protein [Arachnia propionica]|uniref:Zinc ribbon domain-containing protein n=1 Tax=Arachnia propionica TaxID=1750 RepID=A0A3P1WW12_9ACTN|nr:zinc ribbon domain-containing protein [Arachnia propionica]RRD50226.1 zinc ribbon domain-containing protein [Arachnia propionica]